MHAVGATGNNATEDAACVPVRLPPHQLRRWQAIVDTAAELLVSHDYETIQIRNIAARSGVALGTLYRYFHSKELLYATVLREWSAGAQLPADTKDRTKAAGERLRGRMQHSVRRFEQYPTYLRLQMLLQRSTDPRVHQIYDEYSAQVIDDYQALLFDLPQAQRDDVVTIATALLVRQLQLFGQGRQPISEVARLVDRFIDMVFGSPLFE